MIGKKIPQMDFTTYFPQVFWLTFTLGFFFIYMLKDVFSKAILLLKLKGKYAFNLLLSLVGVAFILGKELSGFFKSLNFNFFYIV